MLRGVVRAEGLEPPRLSPREPKSRASTNSATPAGAPPRQAAMTVADIHMAEDAQAVAEPACPRGRAARLYTANPTGARKKYRPWKGQGPTTLYRLQPPIAAQSRRPTSSAGRSAARWRTIARLQATAPKVAAFDERWLLPVPSGTLVSRVPTLVSHCSAFVYKRRNQRDTSNSMILVWLWI